MSSDLQVPLKTACQVDEECAGRWKLNINNSSQNLLLECALEASIINSFIYMELVKNLKP